MTAKRQRYQKGTVQLERRAHGPGVYVFRYRDADGKPCKKKLGTSDELRTQRAVEKAAAVERTRVNEAKGRALLLGAVLDRYEKEALPETYSTAQSYKGILKRLRERWGDTPVDEFNVFQFEEWLSKLKTIPQGPNTEPRLAAKNTLRNYKMMLHRVWQCGMRWQILPPTANPLALVELQQIKRPRAAKRAILNVEEFTAIGESRSSHPGGDAKPLPMVTYVMYEVATRMGLRISEVLGLRWEDIDLEAGTIHIRRAIVRNRQKETKTPESEAIMPMPKRLASILLCWRDYQVSINGWVFGSAKTGRPLTPENQLRRYLRPAAQAEGVERLGWHGLRHTLRSIARDAELEPEDQRQLMRHTQLQTTDIYGKESRQRVRRLKVAIEAISDVLDGGGKQAKEPK